VHVHVHLVVWSMTSCAAATDGLDADLDGFNDGRAGKMTLCAHARAGCGAQLVWRAARGAVPRRPPPCAAALRRAAAAWCGGFPAGASRPLLQLRCLSRRGQERGHALPGALGAPLKTYRKFSPIGQHPLSTSRRARLSLVGRLLRNAGGGQEAGNTCLRFYLMLYTWASRPTIGQVARSRRLTSSR
jgi:hypothetical protein